VSERRAGVTAVCADAKVIHALPAAILLADKATGQAEQPRVPPRALPPFYMYLWLTSNLSLRPLAKSLPERSYFSMISFCNLETRIPSKVAPNSYKT
jgi:hypothetical protein